MPPKIRISKDDIINAAVSLVRNGGEATINARTVAAALGCSTQPIFSNFATMQELRLAVVDKADTLYNQYLTKEIQSGDYPAYKASGMAYIRFAKEEKELFKLLFMRDRSGEPIPRDETFGDRIEGLVRDSTGLIGKEATLFHLEMWAYVHGIATMFATGFLNLDWELVSRMLSDAYRGIQTQYETE